jgi:hypothetical protein
VVSSAPPNTVDLARRIQRRGATAIYCARLLSRTRQRSRDYPRCPKGLFIVALPFVAWGPCRQGGCQPDYAGENAESSQLATVRFSSAVNPRLSRHSTPATSVTVSTCRHFCKLVESCLIGAIASRYKETGQASNECQPGFRLVPL